MNYELIYKWGLYCDKDEIANRWFIRAEVLDTDWYAMAYFNLDDEDAWRLYETNNEDLLETLMEKSKSGLYQRCLAEKNVYMQHKRDIETMTVSNFM
jgi:hypothetical protein